MLDGSEAALLLDEVTGVAYAGLTALILLQTRRSRTGMLLALACACTAAWGIGSAVSSTSFGGIGSGLDLVRAAAWYGFILHLYRRAIPQPGASGRLFLLAGVAIVVATGGLLISGRAGLLPGEISLFSAGIALPLFCALCQILLLENLYRNSPGGLRWILQLTCIALGGLAAYDVVVCADAALLHRLSPSLVTGRPLIACIVVPLLALAAARNHRWEVDVHVSRSAVFYSATLVVSGLFLLLLAGIGELTRQFGPLSDSPWGGVTQTGLVFTGCIILAVLLSSARSRSRLRTTLIDHFFTHRYDYRREWLRCIETLSEPKGAAGEQLYVRAIRALAQLVDSPAGVLLLADEGGAGLQWAGSMNLLPTPLTLAPEHKLTRRLAEAKTPVDLTDEPDLATSLGQGGPSAWLAIPLRQGGVLRGCILAAPPRAAFRLDAEVFDLLRTVASEVATYLAEHRAARVLSETMELRDYGQRFAFVAHDIKNVSSQLSLLLSNAEIHIANPEFQRDMLATVQTSVNKIGSLIRRLQTPEASRPGGTLIPIERLEVLAAAYRRGREVTLSVRHDGQRDSVAMEPASFDAVVLHLLDNAVEAGEGRSAVLVNVKHEPGRILIDIVDHGRGMAPEFIRDQLFQPFRTSKAGGSGIGAFQARELVRVAGGNLSVFSQPERGTTMRVMLPLAGTAIVAAA